jgi:hypothetical protein
MAVAESCGTLNRYVAVPSSALQSRPNRDTAESCVAEVLKDRSLWRNRRSAHDDPIRLFESIRLFAR